jgi:hypothetical protein
MMAHVARQVRLTELSGFSPAGRQRNQHDGAATGPRDSAAPQLRLGYATIRSPGPGVVNLLTVLFIPSLLPLLSSEVTL